jgi:hypothetical protein
MRTLFIPAMALVLGCSAVAAGCGGSSTQATLGPGWVTFVGQSISMALPESFAGGDLADPAVFATLEEAAAHNPDQKAAQVMQLTLGSLKTRWEGSGIQLWMLGEANADGQWPVVQAIRGDMPSNMTLEACIEEYTARYQDHEWTVESVSEDRAYLTERWQGTDRAMLRHWALRVAGPYLYEISCTFDDEADTALESIFRTSVDTIVVKEQ